jgi:hypothetical protein
MSNKWDVVAPREYEVGGQKKTNWTRIGVAFTNKNGSINVQLDAFPIDGKLQLQVPLSKEEREAKFGGHGQAMRQEHPPSRDRGAQPAPGRGYGQQQQRPQGAQRYQQQQAAPPPYQPADNPAGYDEAGPQGWEVNGQYITDPRQLPVDHPDHLPF